MIMPKPDLTALTGGYRKAPVLQIGADIFCDTSLIARELETRFPEPTLFPAGHRGLSYALARWSDKAFFEPGAGLSMGENKDIPEPVLEDRKNFFEFMDFDRMADEMPNCYAQFQAQCQLLEDELVANRQAFLGGSDASWIDIQAYFSVWMANSNVPRAQELLAPFAEINAWSARMETVGRGQRTDIDAADALAMAREATPVGDRQVVDNPFSEFAAGDAVVVLPDDYGFDPVSGTLTALDNYRITVLRNTDDLGEIAVHFPRIGYRVNRT